MKDHVKNGLKEFVDKHRRRLAELQEASFDRGEKELVKMMNDDKIKDTFPAPIPIIALLVWAFILLFPLVLLLDPSNYYAKNFEMHSVLGYYVPLLATCLIFWINQKLFVPKFFFGKKYVKFFAGNAILVFLSFVCREFAGFFLTRKPGMGIHDFFSDYITSPNHFTLPSIVSFLLILFMVCLCSILISVFTRQTMRAFVIRERGRAHLEYELNFMKQQLSPHFLFNTLNNISSLISIDPKLAEKSMTKLSQLLRVTLYQTEDKFITLKEEIEILEKYADLEKLRHDDSFEFVFEKKVQDSSRQIEPLLLMPLLENAMKHCVNPEGKSFAHVFIEQEGDELFVRMENSNFPRKSRNDEGGLGLSTFTKRLSLLYKGNFSFETKVQDDVYSCELKLTLK